MNQDDFMFFNENLNPLWAGVTKNGICQAQANFYRSQWLTLCESQIWQRFNPNQICFLLKYSVIEDIFKYVNAALRIVDRAKVSITLDGWVLPQTEVQDLGPHETFWFTSKPLHLSDERVSSLIVHSGSDFSNKVIHGLARDIFEQELSYDFRQFQDWEYFDVRSVKIIVNLN